MEIAFAVMEKGELMDDLISRQAAIDTLNKLDVSDGVGISSVACDLQEEAIRSIENLPSAQTKTTQVLAEVLDGCPLLHPCDELCKPEGWCREHCKEGQNGPDKDCWMRYAEVMASERSD